jgi:hypothetical protein
MKHHDRVAVARTAPLEATITLPKLRSVMTTAELMAMLAPRLAEKRDQDARVARSRRS